MPIQTLSDVLAQRGAEQNQSQLSQIQQASGLAGLMDMLRKRKQEEALQAQGQEFAGQFGGNDQGSQALKFLASQPGGAQIVAKLLAEQKFKQESRAQALSEIERAGQQPQGQQPLQAVAPIQGQPLGNKIDPQAELAGITDPAQRAALEQVIAAEKQGVQASASVAPKPSNKIFGWDENQAAIAAGSDDPRIAAKGKLIVNEFSKRNAQQERSADRAANREDQQAFINSQREQGALDRAALQRSSIANRIEKPPKDMRLNAQTGEFEVIPGSDLDRKTKNDAVKTTKLAETDRKAKLSVDRTADALLSDINYLIGPEGAPKLHPGVNSAVGYLDEKLPPFSLTSSSTDVANARSKIESLKNKLKASGLQELRASGTAPGSITEREWPIFQTFISSINSDLSDKEFVKELGKFRSELLTYRQSVARNYADKYGDDAPDATNDKKAVTAPTLPIQDKKTEYNDYLNAVKQAGNNKEVRAKIDARARERGVIK